MPVARIVTVVPLTEQSVSPTATVKVMTSARSEVVLATPARLNVRSTHSTSRPETFVLMVCAVRDG